MAKLSVFIFENTEINHFKKHHVSIPITDCPLYQTWKLLRGVFHLNSTNTCVVDYDGILSNNFAIVNLKCDMYGLVCYLDKNLTSFKKLTICLPLRIKFNYEDNKHILFTKENCNA